MADDQAALLHPEVHFKGPMQELDGREAVIEATRRIFPLLEQFDVHATFISGDRAMFAYDFVCSEPLGVYRTAELVRFENGLIRDTELFFDARPFFGGAFTGLWACDSITSFGLALALGAIAWFPTISARALVIILALPLFGFTVAQCATMGNFFPVYLDLAVAVATLLGGLLHHSDASDGAGSPLKG